MLTQATSSCGLDATGRTECIFVDIYDSRLGRPVSGHDAARNLAALNQWFSRRASRSRRLRFLKHYLTQSKRRGSPGDIKTFATQVLAESLRHDAKLERKRDRRIGRNNAFFKARRLPNGACAWVAARSRYLARALPIDEMTFAQLNNLKALAEADAQTGDTPVATDEPHTETWFARSLRDRLIWKFASSPGRQLFRSSWRALHRGIPAAGGVRCIDKATLLGSAWSSWTPLGPAHGKPLLTLLLEVGPQDRRNVLNAAGRLLADTALAGLAILNANSHGLWAAQSPAGHITVYWSGIEATPLSRPAGPHVWKWMLNRLAADPAIRVHLSRADRARVIRAFCRRMGAAAGEFRPLLRDISDSAAVH